MTSIRVTFVNDRIARILFMSSVFLDGTYSYLLARSGERYNHYVRLHNGVVELVRLGKESETVVRLRPYNRHSLRHAAQVYLDSCLPKNEDAQGILESIISCHDDDQVNFMEVHEKLEKPSRQDRHVKKANQVSLDQICEELKITPSRARAIFRRQQVPKPGERWSWDKGEYNQMVKTLKKFL